MERSDHNSCDWDLSPDILFGVEDDDVEFWGVKADKGHIGREGDRHTESCDLDLKIIEKHENIEKNK